ncbi:restriction endonuclease subunit S [Anoxybacteroides amylolyticum]|uniref:Type I restriction modification DNA specificity domain protein n=1 Tax=Anoxybacteroides amylolyticum TaxID=294699 RepID=A0A160F439_9BACL|nr:restriction endonuclease subunit S [Anoxybacillus amylolyticus]ANB60642.1 type I restriction modification DNA specificity domain protein [Anoxybacillus amylolyticus]
MKHKIISEEPSIVWSSELTTSRLDATYYSAKFIYNENKLSKAKTKSLKELLLKGNYGTLPDSGDYLENQNSVNGIYLIRGTDLRGNFIEINSLVTVPASYLTEKAKVENEDVLLLIKGVTLDKEWSVSIVNGLDKPAIFNGSIFRCKFNNEVDPYFMTIYMSTDYFLKQKNRAISNTGIYYNDLDMIHSFKVICPAPEIQSYIGSKVRKAEELREEAKRLKEEAEKLFNVYIDLKNYNSKFKGFKILNKSPFAVLVSAENINERLTSNSYNEQYLSINSLKYEKGYLFTQLQDIAEISAMIGWKNLTTKDYVKDNGVYLLRVQDIKDGYINISEDTVQVSKEKVDEQPQIQLKVGDIVFSKDGSLGFAAVVSDNMYNIPICAGSTLARIRLKKDINPYYLKLVLNSELIKVQISYFLSGIAQPHINQEYIKQLEIPLLKKDIELEIGQKVQKYEINILKSKKLIQEAKQDVEDLIEGKFDESKISEGV